MFLRLIIFAFIFISSNAIAEGTYKWVDKNGNLKFGSNPPKDAKNVTELQGKGFSRYSSSKMLGSLKNSVIDKNGESKNVEPKKEEEANTKESRRPKLKDSASHKYARIQDLDDSVKKITKTEKEKVQITIEQGLTLDPPVVAKSEDGAIERCSVKVLNNSGLATKNVVITFEFADGTIVPGIGPSEINPGDSAIFSVASELLPIQLEPGLSSNPKVSYRAD